MSLSKPAPKLKEQQSVRQIEGDPYRRWFISDDLDLVIWLDEARGIVGFQLCYDLKRDPKAVTWINGSGLSHTRIDPGDTNPGKMKASPIIQHVIRFKGTGLLGTFES